MERGRGRSSRRLSRKILRAMVIFALIICVSASLMVTGLYYRSRMKEYGESAFALGRMAADYIDGDRVTQYVATGEKDEYYEQVQQFMDVVKRESDIWYYYVFVHDGDELIYVWDAYAEEGMNQLGDREPYMEKAHAAVEEVLSENPPEDFIVAPHPDFGLAGTARVPVYDHEGRAVAVVGVDLYMPELIHMLILFVITMVVTVVIVTLVGGAVFYMRVDRDILRPVAQLDEAAGAMVENIDRDVPIEVDIHTGDELEKLADSFCKMDEGLRRYIRELAHVTAEKERIGAELNVATQIQADMLPRIFPPFPERSDIDIYATMTPAKEVGGDFYDYYLIDEDHLGLVMADVSGKGVPAALFMMVSKILLKTAAMAGLSPREILERVNEQICANNREEMFVTVWMGILDTATGRIAAANAGHEYPAVMTPGRGFELIKDKHGFVIGGMEGLTYREYEMTLTPGSKLFLYTDGVPEATDGDNEMFGTDRMLEALNRDPDAPPKEILRNVRRAVDEFVRDAEQFDDLTMLCLAFRGGDGTDWPSGS